MKKYDYIYLLVENDEYEFPVQVAETLAEMSLLTGYSVTKLIHALHRESNLDGHKLYKVDVSEPENDSELQAEFDLMLDTDFEEYKVFCKNNNLNYKDYKSFDKYKEFIKK